MRICRAFIDDIDAVGKHGGGGYKYYGIDEKEGAVVVVRPDGYVGAVTPLNKVSDLKEYFNYFMSKRMLYQRCYSMVPSMLGTNTF